MRVAAAQLRSTTDVAANLALVEDAIAAAGAAGARLVVAPEASMHSFAAPIRSAAEPLDGPFATRVRAAARRAGVVAIVGMFEPAPDGRTYNTLLVTGEGDDGPIEAAYRKIHLFDAFGSRESDTVAPGDALVTFDLAGLRIGLATCYDVRFAEQFVDLGMHGAQLVCLPASWGDGPGKAEQWDLLTRARATDAQAWLLAAGQAWQPPIGKAPLGIGRSVLVDPLGTVRARLATEPGLLLADVDAADVDAARAVVPTLGWRGSAL